jgi:hypothetical protein
MSRKAVRVRSSALLHRLKYAEFSKIQGAAALSLGALDTTELLGEGFVHTIGGVPAHRGASCAPLILKLVLIPLLIGRRDGAR